MNTTIDNELIHYGELLDIYDVTVERKYITQKIIKFENKLYIQIWCDGFIIATKEVI